MTARPLTRDDRRALQAAVREVAPWVDETEVGPRAVDAGQCDRCDVRPRLLPTCGPGAWPALCRACALEVGEDGWCDGHLDDARRWLAWASDLPPWWGDAVVAWWVGTGEVTGPPRPPHPDLPPPLRAALPSTGS